MKKFKKILGLVMVVAGILVLDSPVLADSYGGYIPISVTERGGTARVGIPVLIDLNIQGLVDLGYLDSSGRDTRMREVDYDRPYTLEASRLGLVVYNLTGYQSAVLKLYTGYDPLATDFDLVVGPSGYVTRAYHADLEFGDAFEIELRGYIDTSEGENKNLVLKDTAFKIYISAEKSITASIYNANWTTTFVTATGVDSGIHTVKVTGDGTWLKIYVDDMETEEASIGVVAVPNEPGTDWILMQNSSLVSLEFLKVSP